MSEVEVGLTCGACGQPWTGEKCGQAENGHPFPVCYPVPPITVEECLQAVDILRQKLNDALAECARLRGLVSTGYAHKRPSEVEATPVKRQNDVP